MMMKRLSMSFAAGLVSLLFLPAVASSDETKVISWSTYGNSGSYGYGLGTGRGHTNWRGYNYGSMAAGFDCHKVFDYTHLDDHTPVTVESTQCYDRTGLPYIVPGSSIIMRLDGTAMISMSSEMLFAFDSAEISGAAQAYLTETAAMIRESGATSVTIVGHTDGIGTAAYNKDLSLRRAMAVRDWLVSQGGLGDVDFQVSGVGADEPLVAEQDAEGRDLPDARQANRRVEILYATN
ncbi:MAG: OmpA family protein [Pseudomonadota bacterium]